MHVEFKKSSLPNKGNKPKVQFVPSRFLQDNKVELCKRVLKLELENDDLREEIFSLGRKLEKKTTSSTPPPTSSSPKEIWVHEYGPSPWLVPSLEEVPRYRITIIFITFIYFSSYFMI